MQPKEEYNHYSDEQIELANYRIKPFLVNAIKSEEDYSLFKGVKPSRIKCYLSLGLMLDERELEIILKKLRINPKWAYQIIEPVFIDLHTADIDEYKK